MKGVVTRLTEGCGKACSNIVTSQPSILMGYVSYGVELQLHDGALLEKSLLASDVPTNLLIAEMG